MAFPDLVVLFAKAFLEFAIAALLAECLFLEGPLLLLAGSLHGVVEVGLSIFDGFLDVELVDSAGHASFPLAFGFGGLDYSFLGVVVLVLEGCFFSFLLLLEDLVLHGVHSGLDVEDLLLECAKVVVVEGLLELLEFLVEEAVEELEFVLTDGAVLHKFKIVRGLILK